MLGINLVDCSIKVFRSFESKGVDRLQIPATTALFSKKTLSNKVNKLEQVQSDRKFQNVVIYRIRECSKETPRSERLSHDLEQVTSVVSAGEHSINPLSIRDLLRLGKFQEQSSKPRPLLVKINRTIDVSLLLSKGSLPKELRIKPDMPAEERQMESLLLKERWALIQSVKLLESVLTKSLYITSYMDRS